MLAALAWLSRKNEMITQVHIANHSRTDRMMVSKVLRTLEQKGLISRREHDTDTRAKVITLTKAGEKLTQQALERVEATDVDFFSVLGNQAPVFYQLMGQLMHNDDTL
ncbi:MAG: MarR family transcriptional regulator [Saprospiraceae bacterium]